MKKMAFAQNVRQILSIASYSSSTYQWQINFIRLQSTLTSPKLFVRGLSKETTDEKLKEAFTPFGEPVEAKVIHMNRRGRPRGIGFVTYSSMEEAEKALEQMNANYVDGCIVSVAAAAAKPMEARPPSQPESQTQQPGLSVNETFRWCE